MKLHSIIGLIFILSISGCGNFNLTPEININFQDPTNITETSFHISWSINTTEYQSLTFVILKLYEKTLAPRKLMVIEQMPILP